MEVDPPSSAGFDVQQYAARYHGHTQLARLTRIAERFSEHADQALTVAVSGLKQAVNTLGYATLLEHPRFKPRLQALGFDASDSWAVDTERQSDVLQGKLEAALAAAKASNQAPKIWEAAVALGDFWFERGLFEGSENKGARACYMQAKDHYPSAKHFLDWCLRMTRTFLVMAVSEFRLYQRAINFTGQARARVQQEGGECPVELELTEGLFHLSCFLRDSGNAKAKPKPPDPKALVYAANAFLRIKFSKYDPAGDPVLCHQDIALYTTLCALVVFSRAEIKTKLLEDPSFSKFLKTAPLPKRLLQCYCTGRYGELIQGLLELELTWLRFDLLLAEHTAGLCAAIRSSALVQYCQPYQTIVLPKMAEAFVCSVEQLEDELAVLVHADKLEGKIDSYRQLFTAAVPDPRAAALRATLGAGRGLVLTTDSLLLRASCLEHRVRVQGGHRKHPGEPRALHPECTVEGPGSPAEEAMVCEELGGAGAQNDPRLLE